VIGYVFSIGMCVIFDFLSVRFECALDSAVWMLSRSIFFCVRVRAVFDYNRCVDAADLQHRMTSAGSFECAVWMSLLESGTF